jgi:hypothetical protein
MTITTQPRINPTALQALLNLPPFGAELGIATQGDARLSR